MASDGRVDDTVTDNRRAFSFLAAGKMACGSYFLHPLSSVRAVGTLDRKASIQLHSNGRSMIG
jgi:hypothetical protein